VKGLNVRILSKTDSIIPPENIDEEYSLIIDSKSQYFELRANTRYGALRGIETFSQIIVISNDRKTYQIQEQDIRDSPRLFIKL
jgi:hypothetical protein